MAKFTQVIEDFWGKLKDLEDFIDRHKLGKRHFCSNFVKRLPYLRSAPHKSSKFRAMKIHSLLSLPLVMALLLSLASAPEARAQIKPKKRDVFFYDLSYVQLVEGPAQLLKHQWYSNAHQISLIHEFFRGDHSGLGLGLGYQSLNMHNTMEVTSPQIDQEAKRYRIVADSTYQSNKQNLKTIFLPVELRLRSTANKKGNFFRLYLGLRGGLRIYSYGERETEETRLRTYKLEEMARWTADAYLRLGYGTLGLYARYSLSPVFQSGVLQDEQGLPTANLDSFRSLSVGLSLVL